MRSRITTVLLALVAVALVGAALAWAQSDEVYHACVNNSSGRIFMVSGPEDCKTNETHVNWNQIGPEGPQGVQGPAGPQGPAGGVVGYYRVANTCTWSNMQCGPCETPLCDAGDKIVGGGYELTSGMATAVGGGVYVLGSARPSETSFEKWKLYICNHSGLVDNPGEVAFTVRGICADMTP